MLGNFIGDVVKGRDYNNFPEDIKKGIILHRKIDEFTDKHIQFKNSALRFRDSYDKYKGVVTDILYDHFLASKWENYSDLSLIEFTSKAYKILKNNKNLIPEKFQQFVELFIKNDRLTSYAEVENLRIVLQRMAKYQKMPDKSEEAMIVIKKYYIEFSKEFEIFFEDIQKNLKLV